MTKMIQDVQLGNVIPIRVLHVDDEPEHLELTRIFMEWEAKGDFEIVNVLSVEKALEKLEHEYFDVVVSDYNMPGMNGLAFLEVVRRNSKYSDIPFIFFSGMGGPELVEAALKTGAEKHITKMGDPLTQCNLLTQAIYELARDKYATRLGSTITALEHPAVLHSV